MFLRGSYVELTALVLATIVYSLPARSQTADRLQLVEDGSPARYFKGTVAPAENWTAAEFDDSVEGWLDGHVPFGYGESQVVAPKWTVLNDMRNGYLTAYVRIPFVVDPRYEVRSLSIRTIFDDGIALYLNGVEIGRSSLPAGELAFDTAATSHESTNSPLVLDSPEILNLVSERNVLAVEIHNTTIGSSDAVLQPIITALVSERRTSRFVRGADCDATPTLNISDPIRLLRWTFLGSTAPDCTKACDLNDDGQVDASDAVFALRYLFLHGTPPPPPFPQEEEDPTEDDLVCDRPIVRSPEGN